MAIVQPEKPRARVSETPRSLAVEIPARRNGSIILVYSTLLVVWGSGEVDAFRLLFGPDAPIGAIALIGWTCAGALMATILLWQLCGVETLTLGTNTLVLRRAIFGMGPSSEYELARVRNLRVSLEPEPFTSLRFSQLCGIGSGLIAFDHVSALIRIGTSIDESEARSIVNRLRSRMDLTR